MHKHINNTSPGGEARTPYAQLPVWIIRGGKDVSNGAFRLYAVLKSYTRNGQNTAFPSQKTIADDIGVSERQVYTYMRQLEAVGALQFELRVKDNGSRAKHYEYTLAWDEPFPADKADHQKDTSTDSAEDKTQKPNKSPEESFHRSVEENFESSPEENFRLTTPTELTPEYYPNSPPPF